MELIIFICFFFISSLLLLFFSRKPSNSTIINGYPIVGNIVTITRNMSRVLEWTTELITASPTSTVTIAPMVLTADPAVIEYIAKTNFSNYPKSEWVVKALADCFGRGILSTNGEEWRKQRKATTYEFTTRSLRAFVHGIVCRKLVSELFPLIQQASGVVLDLQETLERFAFDNMCSLMFDEDPNCLGLSSHNNEGERLFKAFEDGPNISSRRGTVPGFVWKLMRWLDIGSERRLRECVDDIHSFIKLRLVSRRENPSNGHDLLSRLAAGEENSDEFIRDMIVALVLAGRDTAPSALTWLFWLLSSDQQVVYKIRDEIKSIRSRRRFSEEEGGEEALLFTLEELRDMHYLHAAISEALRLFPPVPLLPRDCSEDDELPGGTRVKRGWTVMYNSYAMARREELWGKDCGEFKPERWFKDGEFVQVNPYVFPAFFAGPRMCVGKDMAFIQMKAVAAGILERFEVEVGEKKVMHDASIVMKIKGGLPVKFKERTMLS